MHQTNSSNSQLAGLDVAVLIPCYKEETAIPLVIRSFLEQLPEAVVSVYDNNATDNTVEVAAQNGTIVRSEMQQGKGHVVRRMFFDIDAAIYVLVDGDDTYDASSIHRMLDTSLKSAMRYGQWSPCSRKFRSLSFWISVRKPAAG